MAAIASIGSNTSSPLSGIPTPVLLGVVGGGIGLAVFLMRKRGAATSDSSGETQLLPNTAIMLGSLQQNLLDLQGQVGSGFADLTGTVTGGDDNLAAQLDALTAQMQTGLTDLQGNLTNVGNANTASIVDALTLHGDALAKLIGDNATAQQAFNKSFVDQVSHGFTSIVAAHNAETAALNSWGQQSAQNQSQIISILSGIHNAPAAPTGAVPNNLIIFNDADLNWYATHDNRIFKISQDKAKQLSGDPHLDSMRYGQPVNEGNFIRVRDSSLPSMAVSGAW